MKKWQSDEIQFLSFEVHRLKTAGARVDYALVSKKLNYLFNKNRTPNACQCALRRYLKNHKPFIYYKGPVVVIQSPAKGCKA